MKSQKVTRASKWKNVGATVHILSIWMLYWGNVCDSRDHSTCPVEDHINRWVMKQYGVKESWTELLYLSRDQWLTSILHTTAVGIEYCLMMRRLSASLVQSGEWNRGNPAYHRCSATFLDRDLCGKPCFCSAITYLLFDSIGNKIKALYLKLIAKFLLFLCYQIAFTRVLFGARIFIRFSSHFPSLLR